MNYSINLFMLCMNAYIYWYRFLVSSVYWMPGCIPVCISVLVVKPWRKEINVSFMDSGCPHPAVFQGPNKTVGRPLERTVQTPIIRSHASFWSPMAVFIQARWKRFGLPHTVFLVVPFPSPLAVISNYKKWYHATSSGFQNVWSAFPKEMWN